MGKLPRDDTRAIRYARKSRNALKFPYSVCAISFTNDDNTAMALRSAVCFGADKFMIIGRVPDRQHLKPVSGSTCDLIEIVQFPTPHEFLVYCGKHELIPLSIEISESSQDITEFKILPNEKYVLIIGNEYSGIQEEILLHTHHLHIPMPGKAYCLNASHAATVACWEFSRRLECLN